MIARVSLEIALRKEFDYSIPPGLIGQVEVGSRVQVPFGPRKIYGCVTALAGESARANLKPILKVIGAQTMVTPKVLQLARWIAEYYCCAPETALKSVLPEAVRKKRETDDGWKRQLFARALPPTGEFPRLPKRQQEVWNLIEERREILLTELLELAETTAATVRKLEDRGLVEISSEISERDPYAREHILPSRPLLLNPAQVTALQRVKTAMDKSPSTLNPQPSTFLLHGVTGSGKTEIYLQALAHALEQGKGAIVLVLEISLTPQTVERFKARFSSGKLQTLVAVLQAAICPPANVTMNGTKSGRAAPALSSARVGDFCAGRTARPHHRGRGTRTHLQTGGGPALPCAGRRHHARPDGKCRGRARLGHAVARKLLQL